MCACSPAISLRSRKASGEPSRAAAPMGLCPTDERPVLPKVTEAGKERQGDRHGDHDESAIVKGGEPDLGGGAFHATENFLRGKEEQEIKDRRNLPRRLVLAEVLGG